MNRRMVLYTVGNVIKLEAALLILPLITSLIYKESCAVDFLITIAVALIIGFAATLIFKPTSKVIFAKEGFVIVALCWIALSAIGALPFYLSREIPSYIDALFETVSGFTTTGASILTDVESMSRGLLFWRSFTHWIGGMGVLVFVMAVANSLSDRSIHILRAEVPGPIVGKIVPRIKQTTRILYVIYIVITTIEVIFLLAGGMPFFDSLIHAFGTAGTGGFGIKSDSIASYSTYLQWVITIFMLLFGVNFNLYYLLIIKNFKESLKSSELWVYLGIVAASIFVITLNILSSYESFGKALTDASFQVSSVITTTGYATADFDTWPGLSKTILFILMFIGACAGSTGGGFKVSRLIIVIKSIRRELKKLLHPRSVGVIRFEGKRLEEDTIRSVSAYFAIYIMFFFTIVLLLSFDSFDLETNISAATACFNNIGPGLKEVGPAMNYSLYSPFAKIVLSLAMLFGRLEIYPLILTLSPSTWVKK